MLLGQNQHPSKHSLSIWKSNWRAALVKKKLNWQRTSIRNQILIREQKIDSYHRNSLHYFWSRKK